MWVLISWESNSTRERGVDKSRGVSVGLFVPMTRLFANEAGEKVGDKKVS